MKLNKADSEKFAKECLTDKEPSSTLKQAAERYKALIGDAGRSGT